MNKTDIEHQIIKILVQKPKHITTQHVDVEWFSIGDYKTIIQVLKDNKGSIDNVMQLFKKCKENDKHFNMSYADLSHLENDFIVDSHFSYYVNELQASHVRQQLLDMLMEYRHNPTTTTEDSMRLCLSQLSSIGQIQKSGDLDDTLDELIHEVDNDVPQGIKSFSQLDSVLGGGLFEGNLIVIGARPSVGKSAFTVNLLDKVFQRNNDMRIDFFSLEMSKKEVIRRFISLKTGIDSYYLKNMNKLLVKKQKEQVKEAIAYYSKCDLKVYQDSYLEDILSIIKKRSSDKKIGSYLVAIDYVGLVKTLNKKRDRRLEIEEITRELKVLAAELHIPIILLSQLSRGVEQRQDKRPNLSDLRESGSIEQDANVVGFLYYDEHAKNNQYNPTQHREMELIIRKNRDGSLMNLKFDFKPKNMKFEENFTR